MPLKDMETKVYKVDSYKSPAKNRFLYHILQ